MNNKGQTLVIFVIILPILLIIFTLIIDLGFLYLEKKNISNNVIDSLEYYLDNINDKDIEFKVKKILTENIKDIENITINNTSDYIEISVLKVRKSLYSIITSSTDINISYKGNKDNKKIIKG